jgi:hypothetical protein
MNKINTGASDPDLNGFNSPGSRSGENEKFFLLFLPLDPGWEKI